jgi:tRNA-intron endonuclease
MLQQITAVLTQGKVIVPSQSDADSLYQDGYGYRMNHEHYMHPAEILFTVYRNKIVVVDEDTNKTLSFTELLQVLSAETPNLWTNFIVFKDLRTRGFIIKIEMDRFLIYERGTYRKTPPSYVIHIFSEGKPQSLTKFIEELRVTEKDGYEMKVAVVDRRGEIVFYSVTETDLLKG